MHPRPTRHASCTSGLLCILHNCFALLCCCILSHRLCFLPSQRAAVGDGHPSRRLGRVEWHGGAAQVRARRAATRRLQPACMHTCPRRAPQPLLCATRGALQPSAQQPHCPPPLPPTPPRRRTLLTLLLRIAAGRFADDPELFRRVAAWREGLAGSADSGLAGVEVRRVVAVACRVRDGVTLAAVAAPFACHPCCPHIALSCLTLCPCTSRLGHQAFCIPRCPAVQVYIARLPRSACLIFEVAPEVSAAAGSASMAGALLHLPKCRLGCRLNMRHFVARQGRLPLLAVHARLCVPTRPPGCRWTCGARWWSGPAVPGGTWIRSTTRSSASG